MLRSCKLRSPCKCGSGDGLILPGTGPHLARLSCWECGRFIRWLNRRDYQKAKSLGLINSQAEIEMIVDPDMSVVVNP